MNAPECYIQYEYMYIACPVIVVSIDVAVTNITVFSVAMEMHCTVVMLHKILYLR